MPKCIFAQKVTAAENESSEFTDEDPVQFTAIAEKLVMTTKTTEEDSSFEQSLTDDDDSIEERTVTTEAVTDDATKYTDNVSILPDQEFWKSLRAYYYSGCATMKNTTTISLCSMRSKNATAYTDLANFESPDSGEFQNIDTTLLKSLAKSTVILKRNETTITYENVFEFILYGNGGMTNEEKEQIMSAENMLRLVFCFYLDALMLDVNIYSRSGQLVGQGITEQIKSLLSKMIIMAYRNYLILISTEVDTVLSATTSAIERTTNDDDISISTILSTELVTTISSTTTYNEEEDPIRDKCDLLLLNMLSPNSNIKHVIYNDEVLDIDIGKMRHESIIVGNGVRVVYSCGKGYVLNGTNNSVCKDGVWSEALFSCECKCSFNENTLYVGTSFVFSQF